jgi:hypothetical protein
MKVSAATVLTRIADDELGSLYAKREQLKQPSLLSSGEV